MLSSIVSTVSSTMSTTSTVGMMSAIGVSEVSVISVVALIALLSASEILSASKLWNRQLSASLNMAIIPLCLAFLAIVVYRVAEIL